MIDLSVTVTGAQPLSPTASPGIAFRLRIEERSGRRVHAIAFHCLTRIEARARRYTNGERERLYELFGAPAQWHRSLGAVTWAHAALVVPSFDRAIDVDLPVSCTYDLEVASAKYLHAIREGDVPLVFLFTGTVFVASDGGISIEPVPWDLEAQFRMPAQVWQDTMDRFFPGQGWMRLQRDTIDRLQAFRGRHAVVTWDEAIDLLLQHAAASEEPV